MAKDTNMYPINRVVNQFRPDPRTDEECNTDMARRWGPYQDGHVHGGPGNNEPGAIVAHGCLLRVYQGDGSDGHIGSYRYELTRVGPEGSVKWTDGGYSSPSSAIEAGKRRTQEVA